MVRAKPSFDHFFVQEYAQMVAVVYALTGQRWAAEELAQEALIRAYRSWSKVSAYDKPGAWLRRIAINLATSHVRRRIVEAKALAKIAMQANSSVEAHPEEDESLWRAVRRLPARQRQSFVLHYVDDLPVAEIAEVLEIGETTVKTHLQRAREAVQRSLTAERGAS